MAGVGSVQETLSWAAPSLMRALATMRKCTLAAYDKRFAMTHAAYTCAYTHITCMHACIHTYIHNEWGDVHAHIYSHVMTETWRRAGVDKGVGGTRKQSETHPVSSRASDGEGRKGWGGNEVGAGWR
jgi:hypothetical protein